MPEVNLSSLRDRELRQLLDSARQRGQASLSYMILQEMEARRANGGREKPGGRSSARRPAEPRIVAVDLGDPLERMEEFPPDEWGAVAADEAQPPAEPDPTPPEEPPLRLTQTRPPPPPPPPPRARSRSRGGWGALLFACGLALGLAGGWKAAEYAYAPRLARAAGADMPAPPPPAAAPAVVAAAAPPPEAAIPEAPPPPPDAGEPVPQTVPQTAPQTASAAPETSAPAPATAASPPAAEAEDQAQVLPSEISHAAPAKSAGCAAELTAADRTICGDARLQRLQRELRQAYAEALEAHEDRALLRERQLAWADARDAVGDPDRLARLYEERIRKLKAATAQALQDR